MRHVGVAVGAAALAVVPVARAAAVAGVTAASAAAFAVVPVAGAAAVTADAAAMAGGPAAGGAASAVKGASGWPSKFLDAAYAVCLCSDRFSAGAPYSQSEAIYVTRE